MLRRLLLFGALVFLAAVPVRATNAVWLAPTSAGGNTGADCADAKAAVAYFNNASNWSGSPTGILIGPDTTAHLCTGTYTGSAGADSYLQFQGSGTSGHPIILKWETGAIVQAPYFSANHGAIDINGQSYITVDGGTNGILQNTANGTSLTYQQDTALVKGMGNNVTITNLSMLNVYVHLNGDTSGGGTQDFAMGVWGGGANLTVGPGNTFTQCNVCVFYSFTGGEHDLIITGNSFNLSNQDIELGPSNSGTKVLTNIRVDHNTSGDSNNWDDPNNGHHHNFFHPFTNTAGSSIVGTLQVYDNSARGNMGQHSTSMIFIENNNGGSGGTMGNWYIFNNLFEKTNSDAPTSSGIVAVMPPNGFLLNNTILDDGGTGANSWSSFNAYGGATGWTVKGNVFSGGGTFIQIQNPATVVADGNVYWGGLGGGNNFVYHSTFTPSFATWQTACGCDPTSTQNNPVLNSDLTIGAGSSAISLAPNETGLGITALDSDYAGTARLSSGMWAAGGYSFGTPASAITISPSSPHDFGSQNTGTTSGSATTFTITSAGSGNFVFSSSAIYNKSGTNPSEFLVTGGSCGLGQILAPTDTCTLLVKFAPASGGVRSARINIQGNAVGFFDVTGTGVAPTGGGGGAVNQVNLATEVKNILPLANLPAALKIRTCEIPVGDPGAASPVLANDNDTPDVCTNDYGSTITITAVHCFAPVGSPTVTPIITGGSSTSILTGALTCSSTAGGAAGTLNGTPTLTSGQSIDANVTVAGGTAKFLVIRVTGTL